jgi:DNA polymerase-3 subunit epsilon
MDSLNFTAIDFETATSDMNSICAVGIVKVLDGEIFNTFHSLIKPPLNEFDPNFTLLHGIDQQKVEGAPLFIDLWEYLEPYILNQRLVAHNINFDLTALILTLEHYKLQIPAHQTSCTWKMAMKLIPGLKSHNLEYISAVLNIELEHHNPLSDALACAQIYIAFIKGLHNDITNGRILAVNKILTDSPIRKPFPSAEMFEQKRISRECLEPNLEAKDKEHIFYSKKIVFTGDLKAMERNEAAKKVQALGGDVNTSISKKTDYVIVGNNPGPVKMEKIKSLQEEGYPIKIIYEDEFNQLIS